MVQAQILNKIIQDKDTSMIVMNNITQSYFSDYPNEYNFIMSHYRQYGSVPDITTVIARFPDFEPLNVQESNQYLLDALYEDYNTRYLAKTFNRVRELLQHDKTQEAMQLYQNAANDLVKGVHLQTVDILRDLRRYDKYLDKTVNFNKFYIKTGFPELDKIIGGWDREEEYGTIYARPNVGKSYILEYMAMKAVEQGLRVGMYSGEMSENKVGYRLDTLVSHISNTAIMHGDINVQADYMEFIKTLPDKFTGCFKVLTPSMINGPAGVNSLRAFIESDKLDILFVDQHSLLEDDRGAKNPVDKAANISKDLKNLQVLTHIPIITVSQQNRESTKEVGVSSANIAQSDRIGQDSTILIALEQKDGVLTMTLVKSRDSANGIKLNYAVDFDKGIFSFIAEGDISPEESDSLRDEYEYTSDSGVNVF